MDSVTKWSKCEQNFLTNGLSGIDFMTDDPIPKPLINATFVYRLKQKQYGGWKMVMVCYCFNPFLLGLHPAKGLYLP